MKRTVEIGHERNGHIRAGLHPMLLEEPHDRPMVHANHRVHESQTLRRAQSPALRQHFVINVLQAEVRDFAEHIQGIEEFLEIRQTDFPRPALLFDDGFERRRRGAVSSSGIEEHKFNSFHNCFIPVSSLCHARAVKG